MASIKTAYSPEVNTETFVNGTLAGAGIYGIAQAIKKIQDNRRMRRQLAKLEALTQDELAKDDISIAGDFFKDKYTKQAADGGAPAPDVSAPDAPDPDVPRDEGLRGLPGLAWLLTGAGVGYAGSGIIRELLTKKRPAQTPSFAVEYKKQRQKEFERAARLLRAVTDAPTWKDVANAEKTAGLKSWFSEKAWNPFKSWLKGTTTEPVGEIKDKAVEELDKTGKKARSGLDKVEHAVTDYAFPAIYAAAIAGTGYLGYKALNKLLYAIRKYKNRSYNEDAAANAWLAQRKDLGEPGKVLNTYIENDDSEERKELNKLLAAYESRYKA